QLLPHLLPSAATSPLCIRTSAENSDLLSIPTRRSSDLTVVSGGLTTHKVYPCRDGNLVRQCKDGRLDVIRRAVELPRPTDLAGEDRKSNHLHMSHLAG